MKDVFISYSNKDSELARKLRDCVEREGHSCWMAPDDIKGPKTYAEQILEGIRGSRAMLVVISGGANASDHVPREVSLASEDNTPILPVRVEDVLPTGALQYLLQLRHWVDAFPGPIEDHVDSLREAVDAVLQQGDASAAESEQDESATSPTAAPSLEYLEVLSRDESSTEWRVHDRVLGRDISVRELHVPADMPLEDAAVQWERIEQDVANAARNTHPNVGDVYGTWRAGDRFMVSAELLEGETLEARLSSGPLPHATAFDLLARIVSAVSHAHRTGVSHAGIRPENVFLSPEGGVRLAVGTVAFVPGVPLEVLDTRSPGDEPLGSAGYLAPELSESGPSNERADEFSLAVLTYEMLTGLTPFGSETGTEPTSRTQAAPLPSIATTGIDFPQAAAVDRVLARASAKDPAMRYPSVTDFWSALREAWTADVSMAAPSAALVPPVATGANLAEAAAPETAREALDNPPELDQATAAHDAEEPAAAGRLKPPMSRRTRMVLFASLASVALVGLLMAGFFAFGGSNGRAPSERTDAQAPIGPTGSDLLDSASKALEDRQYSVATSMAAAALKLDPSLEESATAVIAEATRLEEIARLKPEAAAAFAERKWASAEKAYARLVELDPNNATFDKRLAESRKQNELIRLYALGRKYEKAHEWAKAKRAYEQVLAKDKKYRDTAERLARVKAALSPPAPSGGSSGGGGSRAPSPKPPSPPPGGEEL